MISNKVFEQEVGLDMAAPEMGEFTMAGGMPDFGYESNVQVAPLRLRQSEADAQQQLMRLSNAALAAIDDDAREELDGDYLSSDEAMLDQDGSNYLMGAELAKLLAGGDAYAAAESLIEKMPEAEREAARVRLNSCGQEADGCRLVGELWRKQVRGQYAEQQTKIHAADVILQKKMGSYVSGAAMATGEDDAEDAMSAAELAQLSEVMDKKALADARAVREWMETYVRPLDGAKDAEYMMRNIDGLEDELYELIGEDEARAGMAYQALMHWAEQVQKSGKVGVRDEFVVAVGKKLSNWGRAHLAMPMISMAPVGSPDAAVSMTPEQVAAFNEVRADYDRKTNSRAMLRAAINKSMEAGEDTGFWMKSARSAARMAGDSLLYFLPGNAGMVAGSLDTILRGFTEGYDEMRLNGMSGSEATGQTLIDTGIQSAVELMPWGRIGGSGLSGFLRKAAGKSAAKPGAFTRWLVKHTQQSTVRALVAEGVSNVIDEAILEPIAGGLMTYGAERTFDLLGVPHGPSRGWAESFDELAQIWGDPSQLAGLVIFSAGIGGASAPRIRENVKWFARTRTMWEAEGLTTEQVDDVMASDDPLAEGTRLVNEGWKNDPVGMRKRIVENNKAIKERGEVLVLTGQGAMDAALANDELAAAYAGVWRAYAENGVLPHVEATGDGKVHITKKDRFGKGNDVDLVLSAEDADAYLIHEFEEVEKRWLKERQRSEGASAERPNLRAFMMRNVSEVAGGAMLREAAEKKAVRVEDVTRYLPEELGALVKKQGGINRVLAERISEWARGMIDGLMADGASETEARRSMDYAEGAVMSLGDMEGFARGFAERGEIGQLTGDVQTSLFRYRGGMERVIDGKKILGSTLFGVPGRATAFNAVEDVAESMLDEVVRARALVLAGDGQMSDAEAEGRAWAEMAAQVARAREAVLKADPKLVIPVPDGAKPMSVIEAFSAMAMSKFILSSATPGWMKPMVEAMKANLTAAAAVDAMGRAWAAAAESDPEALGSLADVLDKVGVRVADALSETRIEQADVVAWTVASGIVMSHVNGPDGAGGMPVSKVVADAEEEEQAILQHEAAAPEARVEELQVEQERAQEYAERVFRVGEQESSAPENLKGIFVGDSCNYNPNGGYYFGRIDKSKLKNATEQVKVGTKGKYGVIAGRELTGNFQADAAPLYVWLRKDGSLWLISGRHRYELLMRDEKIQAHTCYVYIEDAEHDEKWARMMDYENNMRDDQADELTAGTYVRETGLSDAELEVRGLMRNESRSKRGALIGRHAREELWTRFSNGKIKAKDAEVICNLTRYIKDQSRVDEIQRRCCMLLDNGKSWDYIGGMVQLMVQAELEQGQQGWFNFGADFEAALERAATWIEKALKAVNENIELAKRGRDMSGKKADKAARLGIVTSAGEDVQQTLQDLQVLKGKLELIGSYPELRQQAEMWDGESEVDPVGWMLQQQALENERMEAEKELEAEEYLKQQQAEATGTLFSMSMGAAVDLQTVTNAWQNTLRRFVVMPPAAGTAPYRKDIVVCPTPAVMQMVGVTAWDIVISPNILVKCLHKNTVLGNKKKLLEYYPKEKHEHDIELSEMMQLPAALADPVCIVVSDTPGCVEVVTELKEGNKNVLVAVQLNGLKEGSRTQRVNRIASLYGKDKIEAILTHPRLYWNKAKARVWTGGGRLQLPTAPYPKRAPKHKVLKPEDLVKYKSENNLSFSMERNLAAVHTLSPEKFLSALELGGMPMPSVAVTRLDKPYGWGGAGNIMLVGRPALVDPKEGTEVYSRDAWTGNFPRVEHKVIGKKDRSDSVTDLFHLKKKYQEKGDYNSAIHQLDYRINMDYGGEQTGRSDMDYALRQRTGKALFAWQSGYHPRPKMKDAVRVHEWLTKEVASRLRRYVELSPDEYHEKWPEIKEEVRQEIEKVYKESSVIKKAPTPESAEKRLASWVNVALRVFDAYSPSALAKELEDVKKIDARVLDVEANLDMLAKYADKHKKAYEAWIEQKLNTWFSKENYIQGTRKEATLDNLTEYMLGRKARGEEEGLAFSSGRVRAYQAERLYSLEDIKERRESLTDSEASNEMKAQTNEWMSEWREGVAAILARGGVGSDFTVRDDAMETLSKVKGTPTEEKVRAAVRKMFRGASNLQTLLNDAEVINAGVEALKSLHAELEDYMEAVPQRAVQMNEWEYAVMPESLKKNKAVMAGLRENGIRPRFHDGTEDGRKAALAGLVNDARVSFSVVGEKAANWDKIKHLAFRGRDDGKLRVELDASQAKVNTESLMGKAEKAYERLISGWYGLPEDERFAVLDYADLMQKYKAARSAWRRGGDDTARPRMDAAEKEMNAARFDAFTAINAWFAAQGIDDVINKLDEPTMMQLAESFLHRRVDSVVRRDLARLYRGDVVKMEDVLDFPELYEAYPRLRSVAVSAISLEGSVQGQANRWNNSIDLDTSILSDTDTIRSVLLHEIQHIIQGIEGFAKGGNTLNVRDKVESILENTGYRMDAIARDLQWLSGVEIARDYLLEARKLRRRKNAWKYSGMMYMLRSWGESAEETREKIIQDIARRYEAFREQDNMETEYREMPEAKLPRVYFSDINSIEDGLKSLENAPSRKMANRGEAAKKNRKLEELVRRSEVTRKVLEQFKYEPYELYVRLAGEIEARNVQLRRDWTAAERAARPFNETLEYPGEALVSFSMQRVTQRSMELLESRSEEEVAQQIMEDLRKACERLSLLMADDGTDVRRGNGLRVYAEMQALLSAVRQALPEKYLKQGNLEMLLRWASVYAKMATDGEVPARGLIKGDVFDSFVAVLEKQQKQGQLQGMSAEESREALMELAGEKLEVAFMKVARDCVRRIDQFLKDRALERIEWVYQHAYPTREEGRAWGRGKMDSENYRVVNAAWQLVQGSLNKRKEVEEEMRLVRRQMVKVRELLKGKEIEDGEGKRRLKKLQEQLGQLELAAMQAAAEQQAQLIKSISEELESLDTDAADFSDKEAAANERMALQQTFGNWYYKDALEARRAARVFEDMVLRGKKQWEEKLKVEREEIAYWREQILSGFEVGREKATNTRMKQRNAVRTRLDKQLVGMGKGLMNFGHLMLALRPLLGRRFCDMKREQISQMHTNTMAFNTELKNWMFRTLRDITGLQTETEQELWLADQNQARDTGIVITERATVKAALTYAEAKRWLGMSVAKREKERARMIAEAAAAKRKPSNVPTEEMMEELAQLVSEYERDNHGVDPQNKKFVVQAVEEWQTELHTTKDAILFGILTFEQPDYERLMEPNGITPEILDQMRRYVGPKMLRWGYAMREKLSEHGVNVARVFEEYTGIPFDSRENYFKGVFDQGALKEQTLEQAVAAASGASGTGSKYGSLIPRRYHMSKINWDTSAAGVFVTSMQQQNNYVQTSRMVRNWRALLTDKAFAARVEAEIGTAAKQQIIGWLELIEGAVVADVKMAELSNRMMRRMMGGYAKASLGGNIRTLIKQVSALLNGYAGGYVPDKWMLNNELCQEMTYRKIGFGEYMMALARVLSSSGSVSRGETKQQAFIYARKAVDGDGLLRVTYLAANQKLPGQTDGWLGQKEVPKGVLAWLGQKANKVVEKAMDAIAVVDAEMCTASAMAIADVAYRQAVAADVQNVVPDDVKRAEALRLAGMALDVAGQPQLRTQKSYWAASGALGGMGDFLFMFRSDTLSKAGLWIAQATSGEGKAAVGGWLAFGIMNSLVLAMLEGLRGNLGDEDDEWYQYAAAFGMNVLTNDATALPVVGDMLAKIRAGIMGEPVFQNGLSDLVPFGEVFEYGKREVKNIRKGASWDRHWNATAGLLRALGSSCAVCQDSTIGPLANLSSLTMAAAVFANSTKFVQGLIKLGEEVTE